MLLRTWRSQKVVDKIEEISGDLLIIHYVLSWEIFAFYFLIFCLVIGKYLSNLVFKCGKFIKKWTRMYLLPSYQHYQSCLNSHIPLYWTLIIVITQLFMKEHWTITTLFEMKNMVNLSKSHTSEWHYHYETLAYILIKVCASH